jgi:hypothetical protein
MRPERPIIVRPEPEELLRQSVSLPRSRLIAAWNRHDGERALERGTRRPYPGIQVGLGPDQET